MKYMPCIPVTMSNAQGEGAQNSHLELGNALTDVLLDVGDRLGCICWLAVEYDHCCNYLSKLLIWGCKGHCFSHLRVGQQCIIDLSSQHRLIATVTTETRRLEVHASQSDSLVH